MTRKVFIQRLLILLLIVAASSGLTWLLFLSSVGASKPTQMHLYLPKNDSTESAKTYKGDGVLTILLGKNDIIAYYNGDLKNDGSNLQTCDYNEIRGVIKHMKETTNAKDFAVMIKPSDAATYKNTVDALDEMTINGVKKYAMVDITPLEKEILEKR